MRTPSALLLGNGVGQAGQAGLASSWRDLLVELRQRAGVGTLPPDDERPFPLVYEEIFLAIHRAEKMDELGLKRIIAKRVAEFRPNHLHRDVLDLGFRDVLTTNYDHALEQAAGSTPDGKNLGFVSERRYNLFRHRATDDRRIWHIHGDAEQPESIMLGYEQYAGYLQQMRLLTVTGVQYKKGRIDSIVRRLRGGELSSRKNPISWVELFFTRDVYILGLSLDFVEFHLWWLLTYRARLGPVGKGNVSNHIYYIYRTDQEASRRGQAKIDLLRATGVAPVGLESPTGEWVGFYSEAIDWLKRSVQ